MAMEAIGDELDDIVEEVRYKLRQPLDENLDKVVYIEPGVSELVIESIEGGQRSYLPFRVSLYGYINESDSRIGADFIEEVITELTSENAADNFREAFASGDGFSIDSFENVTPNFGDNFFMFTMTISI